MTPGENEARGERRKIQSDASTGIFSFSVFTSFAAANYTNKTSETPEHRPLQKTSTSKLFDVLHPVHLILYFHYSKTFFFKSIAFPVNTKDVQ